MTKEQIGFMATTIICDKPQQVTEDSVRHHVDFLEIAQGELTPVIDQIRTEVTSRVANLKVEINNNKPTWLITY